MFKFPKESFKTNSALLKLKIKLKMFDQGVISFWHSINSHLVVRLVRKTQKLLWISTKDLSFKKSLHILDDQTTQVYMNDDTLPINTKRESDCFLYFFSAAECFNSHLIKLSELVLLDTDGNNLNQCWFTLATRFSCATTRNLTGGSEDDAAEPMVERRVCNDRSDTSPKERNICVRALRFVSLSRLSW